MGLQSDGRWALAAVRTAILSCVSFVLLAAPHPRAAERKASGQSVRDGSFDDLYLRGRQVNATLKTLTARFTETTTSSLLTRPLISRGTIAVERPSRVVLRYTDPDSRIILIDGDKMTMSWPGQNLKQAMDIGTTQRRVQKYFVNSSAEELRHEFDITDQPASERPSAYQLSFTPKRKQIRETLTRLDLWIDRSALVLSAMRMTFASGDTKVMTFDDVVLNPRIEPGTFTIVK